MAPAEQITFTAIGQVTVTRAGPPGEPDHGQVLMATSHAGICGSDLAVLAGHHPWTKPPVVTGHEVAGRVAAAGPGVRLRPGQQAVLNPLRSCGTCARCRQGAVNQCESGAVRGYRLPGAAVTRLLVDEAELAPVPAGVPGAHACLAEPLAAAWHAATRADELDDVAVIGAGSIGQLVLSCLRHRGAGRITVIEPEPGKRELARARGADEVTAPGRLAARPRFTAVYDCVSQPATVDWAAQAAMAGGSVVTVGVPGGPVQLPLPRTQRFEVTVLGSGLYTPSELATAIELIAAGEVDVAPLISDIFPLSQAARAYARAADPASVKVIVAMP